MSEADFKAALNYVTHGPKTTLSDQQRLAFYALYKQITVGECKVRPGRDKVVLCPSHEAG